MPVNIGEKHSDPYVKVGYLLNNEKFWLAGGGGGNVSIGTKNILNCNKQFNPLKPDVWERCAENDNILSSISEEGLPAA